MPQVIGPTDPHSRADLGVTTLKFLAAVAVEVDHGAVCAASSGSSIESGITTDAIDPSK